MIAASKHRLAVLALSSLSLFSVVLHLNVNRTSPRDRSSLAGPPLLKNNRLAHRPYFDGTVHVIQIGDEVYADKMILHRKRNEQWAACNNFTYKLVDFSPDDSDDCANTRKVRGMLDQLRLIPRGDWLIYLDLDVQYASPSCRALEAGILPRDEDCHFLALGTYHTINTGVVMIKSSDFTLELVNDWYDLQRRHKHCAGPADQLSLQEVILELASTSQYDGRCETRENGHDKNICFHDLMAKYLDDAYYSTRSFHQVCLIPCHRDGGLQCKDCKYRKALGGMIRHDMKCNPHSQVFWHAKEPLENLTSPTNP